MADNIRSVASGHIRQARTRGDVLLAIRVGDIVREMHLSNRTPNVCSALASKKFLEENGIKLERREGPPSGQSTTTLFIYRVDGPLGTVEKVSKFNSLRGAAKETFRKLGGGEQFIAGQRESFHPR